MNNVNLRKIAVIGCGFVGSASAFALMQSKLFSEIVLIDADTAKAEGEAMDISHGIPFVGNMKIYAGTYDDIVDAAIIVITAGAGQKPGETRLDLVHKNLNIFKSIIPEIARRGFGGILLVVSNPVDILTYAAVRLSGLPEKRRCAAGNGHCAAADERGVASCQLSVKLNRHFLPWPRGRAPWNGIMWATL